MDHSHSRGRVGAVSISVLALLAVARPLPATTVEALCGPTDDPCVVSSTIAVADESVLDLEGRALRIASGGTLAVGSGTTTIFAGAVTVEQGGSITGLGSGSVPGGFVNITASSMTVAGVIDVNGAPPGDLTLFLTGDVAISGTVTARALSRDGSGGTIIVEGADVSVAGTINSRAGTEDSIGGDVDVTAAGNLTINGTIDTTGPDGGGITVTAGVGPGGGNLTLANSSRLLADGGFQGGFGGSIDITASGNGGTTGNVRLGGVATVNGNNSTPEIGGGSGGCLTVIADGNVVADDPAGLLSVRGGTPDGDGGEIDITTTVGAAVLAVPSDVSALGSEGGAGAFSIDSGGPIVVLASILASGGDGGEVALVSTNAGVTVDAAVTIDTSGRVGGSGGSICIESASVRAGVPASVVVNGMLLSDGGSSLGTIAGGLGGAVEIIGLDSARLAGVASADGGSGGGLGGGVVIEAAAGPAFVEGTVRARGRGEAGGSVTIDGARIEMRGSIDVSGSGGGQALTDIGLLSSGPIIIAGPMTATGSPGSGGLIEVVSEGTVAIAATLTADAGSLPGGRILVRGCTVLNCGFNAEPELCGGATGALRAQGPGGTNRLTGRDEVAVFGSMTANAQTGRNEIVVRPPAGNAVVLGAVMPAAAIITDSGLTPCPVCGNRAVEPPETCDDGNTEDGDGCSADCRLEGDVLRGDVNGDFVVNDEDLDFLITEIFDGDGDAVADVSGGSFRGTPGADTNDDERITAADMVGLIQILGGS
jgi:cysteine-rich repeat protein